MIDFSQILQDTCSQKWAGHDCKQTLTYPIFDHSMQGSVVFGMLTSCSLIFLAALYIQKNTLVDEDVIVKDEDGQLRQFDGKKPLLETRGGRLALAASSIGAVVGTVGAAALFAYGMNNYNTAQPMTYCYPMGSHSFSYYPNTI